MSATFIKILLCYTWNVKLNIRDMTVISKPLNKIHEKIEQNHFLVRLSASSLMMKSLD